MKYFFHLRSNTCLLLTRGSDDGHPGKLSKERLLSKVLRWRSVGESQARIPCSTNNSKVRVVMKLNICAPLARSSGNRMFRYKVLSIPTQAVKVHKNFVHFNSLRVNNKHILSQRNDRQPIEPRVVQCPRWLS